VLEPATKRVLIYGFDGTAKQIVNVKSDGRIVVSTSEPQNVKITESGNYTYVAYAPLGTAQASALWQAFRIDETSGLVVLYADGNANYDNVATDLTALTYS
jgi:biopolymer transport protein ExbD